MWKYTYIFNRFSNLFRLLNFQNKNLLLLCLFLEGKITLVYYILISTSLVVGQLLWDTMFTNSWKRFQSLVSWTVKVNVGRALSETEHFTMAY